MTTAAKPEAFRIDVHHHVQLPRQFGPNGPLFDNRRMAESWTLDRTFEDMENGGVKTSIISMPGGALAMEPGQDVRALAREGNDYVATLVRDYPGRFGQFATLPLADTEGSLREIEYAFDVLKADGIHLRTNYNGVWLGDPAFEPVYAELNRRKAVVYTHPSAAPCCHGLMPDIHDTCIEFGTDTTRAITRIVFSGVSSRYPDITWIFSHGGGTMPYLYERLLQEATSYGLGDRVPNGLLYELRRFYYDTAQAAHPTILASITQIIPTSHILFGTDFPFRRATEYVKQLRDFGFSDANLRSIEHDNAARLLPRFQDKLPAGVTFK